MIKNNAFLKNMFVMNYNYNYSFFIISILLSKICREHVFKEKNHFLRKTDFNLRCNLFLFYMEKLAEFFI